MAKVKGIPQLGKSRTPSLGSAVIKILAIGFTGGLALIGGAKKVGDAIEKKGK